MQAPSHAAGPLLRTSEIAKTFSLSEAFFKNLRISGDGPPFIKAGPRAVLYDPEAVRSWLQSRERTSTTGEVAKARRRDPRPYTGRPRGRPRKIPPADVSAAAIDLLG